MCKCISALSIYTIHIFWKHNTKLLYGRAHKSRQDKMFCFSRAFMVLVCALADSCACLPETYHHQYQCHCLVGRLAAGRTAVDEFRVSDLCITLIFPWLDFVAASNLFFSFWTTFPVTLSNSIWYDIRMLCVLCASFLRFFSLCMLFRSN